MVVDAIDVVFTDVVAVDVVMGITVVFFKGERNFVPVYTIANTAIIIKTITHATAPLCIATPSIYLLIEVKYLCIGNSNLTCINAYYLKWCSIWEAYQGSGRRRAGCAGSGSRREGRG